MAESLRGYAELWEETYGPEVDDAPTTTPRPNAIPIVPPTAPPTSDAGGAKQEDESSAEAASHKVAESEGEGEDESEGEDGPSTVTRLRPLEETEAAECVATASSMFKPCRRFSTRRWSKEKD